MSVPGNAERRCVACRDSRAPRRYSRTTCLWRGAAFEHRSEQQSLVLYDDGAPDLPMTEPAEVVAPKVESTHFVGHQPNLSGLARNNVSTNAKAWGSESMHNVKGRQREDHGNTALEHDLRWRELETLY